MLLLLHSLIMLLCLAIAKPKLSIPTTLSNMDDVLANQNFRVLLGL